MFFGSSTDENHHRTKASLLFVQYQSSWTLCKQLYVGFAPLRPEYRPGFGCPHSAFTRRMEPAFLTVLCAFDVFWLRQYATKISLLVFRCRSHIFFVSKPYIKCILRNSSIISNNTTVIQIEIRTAKDKWTENETITAVRYGNKTDKCT
jgi:hypothetical protein